MVFTLVKLNEGITIEIKGSCEQLMDECILVPLFQNESLCETFHIKMSLIIMKTGANHMNGFAFKTRFDTESKCS